MFPAKLPGEAIETIRYQAYDVQKQKKAKHTNTKIQKNPRYFAR